MKYQIKSGKLETRSIESHITDHCNLRCQQCCSLSPYLKSYNIEPDRFAEDIRLAKRVLQPQYFKLVGGEPLLHPQILTLLRLAKESLLAPILSITTNGHFIDRLNDEMWSLLDHLTLSLYPSAPLTEAKFALFESKARQFNVTLNIKRQASFQEMTLSERRTDQELTDSIYERCWLKRRCHMVREGRFYMCTRPPHFDSFYQGTTKFAQEDGIELNDDQDLVFRLAQYLERTKPLDSCGLCLGGDGKSFPHKQLSPQVVASRAEPRP